MHFSGRGLVQFNFICKPECTILSKRLTSQGPCEVIYACLVSVILHSQSQNKMKRKNAIGQVLTRLGSLLTLPGKVKFPSRL